MRPLRILHIEDSEEDAVLFGRACEASGLPSTCYAVRDGLEAVAYLAGAGKYTNRSLYPFPDLIVLDLKMPGMNGFDFLKWLRQQAEFLSLPVLVFTRSTDEEDKVRAINEGASGYFIKPKDFASLVRLTQAMGNIGGNGDRKK
jgi:CheY-like chemotaxis protein